MLSNKAISVYQRLYYDMNWEKVNQRMALLNLKLFWKPQFKYKTKKEIIRNKHYISQQNIFNCLVIYLVYLQTPLEVMPDTLENSAPYPIGIHVVPHAPTTLNIG